MARVEEVTRRVVIEETRIIRELSGDPPKRGNIYHWISDHLVNIILLLLLILGGVGVLGVVVQHTVYIFK